jgi:GT2 family glycosyltransferase
MLNQDRPPDEIVVLDNDPQGSGCRAEHIGDPAVRYYRAREDLGIVEGRNCAAAEAKGDILLFMNDYIRFDKYHVTNLMINAFRPREISCLAFQVRNAASQELIPDEYPGRKMNRWTEEREVCGLSTSVFAIRRRTFEEVGGFDVNLFGDEAGLDLAFRAIKAGGQIRYLPGILVNLRATMRDTEASPQAYYRLRNRLYLALKHLPFPYIFTYAVAWGFFSLFMGLRERQAGSFIQAIKAFKREGLWETLRGYRHDNPPSWKLADYLQRHEGRAMY